MNFQEAEKAYKDLRIRHNNGKLSDADFEAQVSQLKVQDAEGRWWQIGVRSGDWYVNDGQKWTQARPPVPTPQATAPTTSPEESGAEQPPRVSVLPRGLFAPKPVDRNGGGLPTPILIGIIAVVAIAVIAILAGGYFFFSGQSSGPGARASTTPTLAAVVPSTEVPTLALPIVPITSTLALSPTVELTPTVAVTPTNTVAPATPRPTVRRTATPTPTAGPKATATLNVPPGIYVTKLQLDTPVPEPNKPFGFRVTFFNNSGGTWHHERGWLIRIFQVNIQERSFGETALKVIDVQPGMTEVALPDSWNVGPAGPPDCNYVAGVYYLDENSNKVPFPQLDGKQFRLFFNVCK